MLSELTIKNLAIIEEQVIPFRTGFNVISGETGAGKSLMLQALGFLLGEKIAPTSVRKGADEIEVHAVFDLSHILEKHPDDLPEIARVEELVVSRTQPREGRGRVLINGRPGSVPLLAEITARLVSISSQHQSVRLLKPQYHLELLDEYAEVSEKVRSFSEKYRALSEIKRELTRHDSEIAAAQEKRLLLEDVISDLEKIGIRQGLRSDLEEEITRLSGGEKILSQGSRLLSALRSEESPSTLLKQLLNDFQELGKVAGDPWGPQLTLPIQQALTHLDSAEDTLSSLISTIDLDDQRLEETRGKLSELARLERKYRSTDSSLFERLDKAKQELSLLADDQKSDALRKEANKLQAELEKDAKIISEIRKTSRFALEKQATQDLSHVAMAGSSFVVEHELHELRATGVDTIVFKISTNKGQDARSLAEVASGGELSRLTLVLKRLLGDKHGVPVLVFDEVDSGVSGSVARSVGKMLRDISTSAQVICVTHLPQVASLADNHLLVRKEGKDLTRTVIERLKDDQRVDEIARMLSGHTVTDAAKISARELMEL